MSDPGRAYLLIVDDEVLNRELLRRLLQREYQIEEAEDVVQALEVLERLGDQIKVVLCDQLMPGESGTQLAARIRDRWPEIVFLLLTGYDDDPAVRLAQEEGLIRQVISKPWRGRVLKALLAEILAAPE